MIDLNKQGAFVNVLAELKDSLQSSRVPAYVGLIRLVTLAGKLPFRLALASLTPWEANVIQSIMGHDDIPLVPAESSAIDECNILITLSPFGKVSLYKPLQKMLLASDEIVAGIYLDSWLLDTIEDASIIEDLLEKQERQRLDEMLLLWQAQTGIDEKIDQIIDWIERIDNVLLYIENRTFSKSDIGSNTLLREKLLLSLKGRDIRTWAAAERLFVAAMHLIALTGRFSRVEEFNGMQLTACRLRQWLIQKLCFYAAALGEKLAEELMVAPLPEIALRLEQLTQRIPASAWIPFRRINGITLVKEEYLVRRSDIAQPLRVLPTLLVDFATHSLGIAVDAALAPEQSMELITLKALQRVHQGLSSELEHIIELLVLSSILEAKADYGMSSSLRNPSRLKGNDTCRGGDVFSLTKEDFFCCVLPHPQLVDEIPAGILGQMLYSSALRMQFNRWHFIPGNFSRSEVPVDRHYFFPPQMPDIAAWSDLWHAGHVAAQVRYAIRAPGPPLQQAPLSIFGHPYRGFYDIRLVRTKGTPFEKHHLWIADWHRTLLGIFWMVVLAFAEHEQYNAPLIYAYTREWYMTQSWREVVHGYLTSQRRIP